MPLKQPGDFYRYGLALGSAEVPLLALANASGAAMHDVGGTILALDPDIPPQRQRVRLRAEAAAALRWQVDGRAFAHGAEAAWFPWPGRHILQLVDARGQVVDAVRVEVRGAGTKLGHSSGSGMVAPTR